MLDERRHRDQNPIRFWSGPLPTLLQFLGVLFLAWGNEARADDLGSSSDTPAPTIDLPGDSAMDRFYGELSGQIPIVAPAFHGIEPRLALHYHSNDRNG